MELSNADNDEMLLYRAVSQEELDDIGIFGGFRPGSGQLETKLFTLAASDASFFAREILYPLDQKPLTIVEVNIPSDFGGQLFQFAADGKPTIAVDRNQLDTLNVVCQIRVMHSCPISEG